MDQIRSVTHRDEKFWRLMVALFGMGMYAMITVMLPAHSTIPSVSPSAAVPVALFAMMSLGALFISLSPVVWKYWLTALFELAATGLAVCAAWVFMRGLPWVPNMPENLWVIPAFVLYFFGGVCVFGAAMFRALEPGKSLVGISPRILWESLLPIAMLAGTYAALEGMPSGAFSIIAALMTIQMSWAPGWKTSEIQTCCPG